MASVDPGDEAFRHTCRDSTLTKMHTMSQLTRAMDGDVGVKFASLIRIGNVIAAIVKKDRQIFAQAITEMRSLIAQKKTMVTLQNISVIAEINFLEGFDSFVSYIYQGNVEEELGAEASTGVAPVSGDHSSPMRNTISPKRRASKGLDEARERTSQEDVVDHGDEEEEEESVRPIRKSIRLVDNDVKFVCVFNGCSDEFPSAVELAAHAEGCVHKADLVLVFRCSVCKISFSTDKAVKLHIGNSNIKCINATIKIESEKKCTVKPNGEENVSSMASRESVEKRNTSELKCPSKGCKYSNTNLEMLYVHAKSAHTDFNTIFTCLSCGETRMSGKAMKSHIAQMCMDAKIKLKLVEKEKKKKKTRRVVTRTPNDPTIQRDHQLCKCPIPSCKFVAPAVRHLAAHFKSSHSESTISYECSKCAHPNASILAMIKHCKTCQSSPEILVNGRTVKRTPKGRRIGKALSAPTAVMKKRGRSSLNEVAKKAEVAIVEEEDEADIPVVEMIDMEDEDADGMGEMSENGGEGEGGRLMGYEDHDDDAYDSFSSASSDF